MITFRTALLVALGLILAVLPLSRAGAEGVQVLHMSIQPEGEKQGEIVSIRFSAPVPHRAFLLPEPPRMVIDLPPFQWLVPAEDLRRYSGQLVKNVRYARFDARTSRIVMDLTQALSFTSLSREGESAELSYRLQPVCRPGEAGDTPMNNSGIAAHDMTAELAKRPAVMVPPSAEPAQARYATVAPDNLSPGERSKSTQTILGEGARALNKPLPASAKASSSSPSGRGQQCLPAKPLVVIDAGHGGQDPGTIGRRKTQEKNVTLAYAKALKQALEGTGKFRVALTRADDRFILLRERFHIARRMNADLFISLHADSAPNINARGLSVYTVSEDASDAEAAALAAQENKVDVLADMDLTHQDGDVADILIDLAQRDTKNKSIKLADHLVSAMHGEVPMLPNPHRYAGFAVLKAPDIASALVEIGFLSHPQEEQVIQAFSHREQVVQGLTRGITNYFAEQRSHE